MNLSWSALEILRNYKGMLTTVQNNPNIQFKLGIDLWSLFRTTLEGIREKKNSHGKYHMASTGTFY